MGNRYEIVSDEEFEGATIFIKGQPHTVGSDNENWALIVEHLIKGKDDDDALLALVNPAQSVSEELLRLTERVSYKNGILYFDGDVLDNALAKHIISIIQTGADQKDYLSFALFLENLAQNPSKKSRKHLYAFIETHGMTISEDGMLIAYKGTKKDGSSINTGYGIVDGVEYGKIDGNGRLLESAALPNQVGSVVEIPRSLVNDDRSVGCSTGLHAGSYEYARGFAQGLLLTVKVNPRDVVSVPEDCANAKIRTARYTVLEVNEGGKIDTLTYDTSTDPDDDESDDDEEEDDFYESEEEDEYEDDEEEPEEGEDTESESEPETDLDAAIAEAVEKAKAEWEQSLNNPTDN